MFGLELPELLVILIVALILFGPEKLPEYGQKLGHWVYKAKQAYINLQRQIHFPSSGSPPAVVNPAYLGEVCPQCHHQLSRDFLFCPYCGQRLREQPSAPPSASTA